MKDKQDADKLKLAPRPSNPLNILSYHCKNIILYTINNNNQVNILITARSASIKLMDFCDRDVLKECLRSVELFKVEKVV